MKIKYFAPLWGSEQLDFNDFCLQVSDAGYDGIEMSLLLEESKRQEAMGALQKHGLEWLAQHGETDSLVFEGHLSQYRTNLERAVQDKPQVINCHTGKDFFTFEQNLQLIDTAAEISTASGVPIIHETHRGRFPYSAALTKQFLDARPALRLTADFSHWCNVSESLLQGQEDFIAAAIERTDHIHSRVGHEQGPQVNDPRAPEWEETVQVFLGWWDRIVDCHRTKGSEQLTITTEFGPWPYNAALPFTQQPIVSQWDINLHMMNLLRQRYT